MKILIINIMLTILSLNMVAQPLDEQKKIADSLFIAEKYFDAITEYKRLLFFDESNTFDYSGNLKIARSYKAGAKYGDAIQHYILAKNNCSIDSNLINIELEIIRVNILRRTTPEAIKRLDQLQSQFKDEIDSSVINYWRGWAYIMADEWESAADEFNLISNDHPLKKISDEVESEKYSVNFAKISSLIIPGSGQVYTGNYLSGVMSLGWNVLWGYLTINAFMTERAVEGILIGGLLWTRFYKGNFQNAEKFALEKNKEISNKAYEYLAKEFKGEKP